MAHVPSVSLFNRRKFSILISGATLKERNEAKVLLSKYRIL